MIQVFYCTNTREYTNIPSCKRKLVFDSSRLQEGIVVYTLVKLYNKAKLIAPLSDISMFYSKYLTIHKVHMRAGAIRQLLYSCMYVCMGDNPLAQARGLSSRSYAQTIQ